VCVISNEEARQFLARAGRCDTRASHKINKNTNTETTEIIDPTLATTFQ
jgi:hypothetical protein